MNPCKTPAPINWPITKQVFVYAVRYGRIANGQSSDAYAGPIVANMPHGTLINSQ